MSLFSSVLGPAEPLNFEVFLELLEDILEPKKEACALGPSGDGEAIFCLLALGGELKFHADAKTLLSPCG